MQFLTIFVVFTLVYFSVALPTTEKNPELKPEPKNGTALTDAFKKIVDEMKKLDTGIVGWDQLQAGECRLIQRAKKYRCLAFIPNDQNCTKKSPLKLMIDVRIADGKVSLYDVHGSADHAPAATMSLIDFWSDLRDRLLGNAHVDCNVPLDSQPSSCNIGLGR